MDPPANVDGCLVTLLAGQARSVPATYMQMQAVRSLPVSVIVPTRNRPRALRSTLNSLHEQEAAPSEIIVVDASDGLETLGVCEDLSRCLRFPVRYAKAEKAGAAAQRNQGIRLAIENAILFCDDDILLERECLSRMWQALETTSDLGGVNATIVNQQYQSPGAATRLLLWALHGRREPSYAGRCIGPALNLLPEDRSDLGDVVPVEWLNSTCTLYRREALPIPAFAPVFEGYSWMEDVALSLNVGKRWRLANARTARIYHDSQPGSHKADEVERARMELFNRHYVMTEVLHRRRAIDYWRLALLEGFGVASVARSNGLTAAYRKLLGIRLAVPQIIRARARRTE